MAQLVHPVQHPVAPLAGRDWMEQGVIPARVLHDAGEGRGLVEGELVDVLAEVVLGCGLDTVRPVTEVGDVEVALQDLLLGELVLQGDRVLGFTQLARHRAFGSRLPLLGSVRRFQQDVLDVLLCQGRPALREPAGLLVGDGCPGEALEVDAVVLVEARVLDVDDGLLQVAGDEGKGHHLPVLAAVQVGDHVPLGVVHLRRLRQRGGEEVGGHIVEGVRATLGRHREQPHDGPGEPGQDQAADNAEGQHPCAGGHEPAAGMEPGRRRGGRDAHCGALSMPCSGGPSGSPRKHPRSCVPIGQRVTNASAYGLPFPTEAYEYLRGTGCGSCPSPGRGVWKSPMRILSALQAVSYGPS